MSQRYVLGGRHQAGSFPLFQFLGVLALVLGVAGAIGWYALRQPPTATIRNAAPVTRTVVDPSMKR